MPADPSELQLAGGISKQPAHMRFPNQVEDANNAVFSLADGASKRPGSIYVKKIPLVAPYYSGATLVSGTVYKLHAINRDPAEKYLVVYAAGCLRVFRTNGEEAAVQGLNALSLTPTPATYYSTNNATINQLRFLSVADYTIIANTTVALGTSTTPTFTVTSEWASYDALVSHTPTSLPGSTVINTAGDLTYHKTNAASDGAPAGYWKYSVSGNTFPTIQFAPIGGSNGGGFPYEWADTTKRGFRIRFEKRQDTFTTAAWTTATKTLTLTGNWASYVFQVGDDVYVSGGGAGGHIVAGWYKIVSRGASGNSLVLDTEITNNNSNQSNVTGGGIGQEYRVAFAGTGGTLPDMHAVAKFIEGKLQAAGAKDALLEWTDTAPGYGYFTITAPWRGSGAKVTVVTTNPSHPGGDIADDTAGDLTRANGALGGYPQAAFNPTNAVLVLGGGSGPRTLPMDDRWTRVAAPGDADGSIDPTKAPIKMVRASPATSGTVTAISVAAAAVVTTGAAHGLVPGQMVTIADTVSSATTVGTFAVVTVPSATTFTIAVNTTGGVSDGVGTFTAPAYFTYDFIEWKNRTSGTDITNPSPKPFLTGLKIADIGFLRQRFFILSGEWVIGSATADIFQFYKDDAANLVDSDPILGQMSSSQVTIGDFFTPVRDSALITTLAGRHFVLGAPEALTPSTFSLPEAFSVKLHSIRPVVQDSRVYMLATAKGKSQLREAFFADDLVPNDTADVSAHVAGSAGDSGLLPATPQTICEHANSGQVFVLPPNSNNKIYVYKSSWNGERKDQSAWTVWAVTAGTRICDIAVVDDDLFMLVETASQFVLEKIPLFEPAAGNYPFNLHMDRQMELQGVYVNPTTTWTLPDTLSDTAISRITLRTGAAVTVASNPGTTVTATGDYSALPATLGRSYGFSVTLTEPFLRDGNGNAIIKYALHQKQLLIRHITSGEYSVTSDPDLGASTVFTCNPPSGSLTDTNQRLVLAGGDMSKRSILISSASATPLTIGGVSHVGDWGVRGHPGGQ